MSTSTLLEDIELLIDRTEFEIKQLRLRIELLGPSKKVASARRLLGQRERALKRMLLQRSLLVSYPGFGAGIQPELCAIARASANRSTVSEL